MKKFYELLDHPADLGIRVYGRDEEELLINAAKAFFDCITDLKSIRPLKCYHLEIEATDLEECLFNWLDELLFLFDTKKVVASQVKILSKQGYNLKAELQGEPFNPQRHPLKNLIKAVTYHNLKVLRQDDHLIAEVIFDI